MMQETRTIGPANASPRDIMPGQTLVALLALVGTRRMDVEVLRNRTKLAPVAFGNLLAWLQREYLVDVVSALDGEQVEERIELTENGESVLLSMLEKTCELPELR